MKITALQMRCIAGDVDANLAQIETAARKAAAQGADLLIAPELALTGYGAGDAIAALAEPAGGPAISRLDRIAAETGVAIVTGFAEAAENAVWNSAVFADGRRDPVVYRKSHLYGGYEKALFRAAAPSAVTLDHAGHKLGMLICFDVEFPENVRLLAREGCSLVIAPTALPVSPFADFIARKMIPVRAFENQLFVAYVNHAGSDGRFTYAGLSTIAAPDGSVLAGADDSDETLLFAELRPDDFEESAAQNSYLRDLRL